MTTRKVSERFMYMGCRRRMAGFHDDDACDVRSRHRFLTSILKIYASRIAHARSHVPVRLMARLYGQWRGSVRRANDTMAHALAVLLGKISGISTRRTDGESASIVTSERTSTSLGFIEPFATSI